MPLSASQLKQYLPSLELSLKGRHLNKPILYAHNAIFFSLSGDGVRRLSIVLDDADPRVYLSTEDKVIKSEDSSFFDGFKRELGNPYVVDVRLINDDRVLAIDLTVINSVYKEEAKTMIIELLPHHSNLLVTNNEGKILVVYKPSDLTSERPLGKGLSYLPPKKADFKNLEVAFDKKAYESACLLKEMKLSLVRKKDFFGDIYSSLKRREKTLKRKITAINGDIEEAKNHLEDNLIGDYIYTNYPEIPEKSTSLNMDGKDIPLDPRKNKSQNAEGFYRRSKKSKSAIEEGMKNLRKAEDELENLELSLSFYLEGDEEGLEKLGSHLKLPKKKDRPKEISNPFGLSSSSLPYFVIYDGIKILFGTSAEQNNTLTFLLDTSKDHLWLHVNMASGSHVMIKNDEATEKERQIAAEIAIFESKLSSGEVMITERRNVSRGHKPGEAIVKKFFIMDVASVSPTTIELLKTMKKYTF